MGEGRVEMTEMEQTMYLCMKFSRKVGEVSDQTTKMPTNCCRELFVSSRLLSTKIIT